MMPGNWIAEMAGRDMNGTLVVYILECRQTSPVLARVKTPRSVSMRKKQDYATGIRAVPRVREKGVDGGWWAMLN